MRRYNNNNEDNDEDEDVPCDEQGIETLMSVFSEQGLGREHASKKKKKKNHLSFALLSSFSSPIIYIHHFQDKQ